MLVGGGGGGGGECASVFRICGGDHIFCVLMSYVYGGGLWGWRYFGNSLQVQAVPFLSNLQRKFMSYRLIVNQWNSVLRCKKELTTGLISLSLLFTGRRSGEAKDSLG